MSEGVEQPHATQLKPENPIERKGEITRITKPEGQYVIMYGTHVDPRDPNKLPNHLDAVVFENAGESFYSRFSEYWPSRDIRPNGPLEVEVYDRSRERTEATLEFLKNESIEYSPIMPKIEAARIPVIFADMAFKKLVGDVIPELYDLNDKLNDAIWQVTHPLLKQPPPEGSAARKVQTREFQQERGGILVKTALITQPFPGMSYPFLVAALEGAIGTTLLAQIIKNRQRKTYTRRDFLIKGAKAAVGAWLLMPAIEGLLFTTLGMQGEFMPPDIRKLVEKTHPETWFFLLTLRNIVLAHKEQWLMETMGNKPVLATTIGSAHTGLEDQIMRSPEERLQFLRAVKPLLNRMFDPESIYKMVQFNFYPDRWNWWGPSRVYEIPELKELVTS